MARVPAEEVAEEARKRGHRDLGHEDEHVAQRVHHRHRLDVAHHQLHRGHHGLAVVVAGDRGHDLRVAVRVLDELLQHLQRAADDARDPLHGVGLGHAVLLEALVDVLEDEAHPDHDRDDAGAEDQRPLALDAELERVLEVAVLLQRLVLREVVLRDHRGDQVLHDRVEVENVYDHGK